MRIAVDPETDMLLRWKGYVVIQLLNNQEVESLRDFYLSFGDSSGQSAFTTFACNEVDYRRGVDRAIKQIVGRHAERLFPAYRPFWGNFFTKPAGAAAMPLHADLQYVDESEHISLNIWCPLVDTDDDNGALGVVPGSHLVHPQIRGTGLPQYYTREAGAIVAEHGRLLRLRAGEAVIYDHRLLHYSNPNVTGEQRLAATLIAVPRDAELLHFHCESEESPITKYVLEDEEDLIRTPFFHAPVGLEPSDVITHHPFRFLRPSDFVEERPGLNCILRGLEPIADGRAGSDSHRLLLDRDLNKALVLEGHAVIRSLLDEQEVRQLQNLYAREYVTRPGMYVTHTTDDAVLNKAVSESIHDIIVERIAAVMTGHRPIIAHFAVKSNSGDNRFDLHQDWSLVDEDAFAVAHVWIALTDIGPEDGGLVLIPRSHLLLGNPRSGTLPIRYASLGRLSDSVKRFRLSAGDAVVYHPAVFHGSDSNCGVSDRLAVIAAFCHKDADLGYYQASGDLGEVIGLDGKELFHRLPSFAQGERPSGEVRHQWPVPKNPVSGEELEGLLRRLAQSITLSPPSC